MPGDKVLLIAAAGTGGHILPGIQIGREFEASVPGGRAVYLCGAKAIEKEIYQRESIDPVVFPSYYGSGSVIRKLTGMAGDFRRSLGLLGEKKPMAVIAMGGAICAPLILAARWKGIPYFLHESNAIPGRVVRMFHRGARKVFLGLGGLKGRNISVTGTPVKKLEGEAGERRLVLCLGGSQGARHLNEVFVRGVALLPEEVSSHWEFLLVAGPSNTVEEPGRVRVVPYITDLPEVLSRAAFAVSRAGAGTLADLAAFAIPSLLVPYPFAKDDHQRANARVFEKRDAAILKSEGDLNPESLAWVLSEVLVDPEKRSMMARAAAEFDAPDSARIIVREMLECLSPGGKTMGKPRAKGSVPHGRVT